MAHILFLRHGKVDLPFDSHDVMPFSTLRDLGTGSLDPLPDLDFARARLAELDHSIQFASIEAIFTSPSMRCVKTGALLQQTSSVTSTCTTSPLLSEIHFDLSHLSNGSLEQAVHEQGMSVLNDAVFSGMLNGECETAATAYERIRHFFLSLPKDVRIACICHDFIMRIIELYIRNKGEPITITRTDLEKTYRNGYLQGFQTDSAFSNIERIE